VNIPIPTDFDWNLEADDQDMKDAYRHFFGKTNDDMQKEFKFNSRERCFDLRYMPFKAFHRQHSTILIQSRQI
jgi:hypothetical protein